MTGRSGGTTADRGRPAVLHLVWAPLGPAPLRDFLASYHAHEAGRAHDLVVVLNGASSDDDGAHVGELLRELDGTEHRLIRLSDSVLDLVAYRRAVELLDNDRVCVLNSYSRVRADGWLAMLNDALRSPDVGLVGATGSWASHRSIALFQSGLPSAYRAVYPDRAQALAQFTELSQGRSERRPSLGLREAFDRFGGQTGVVLRFPPFPAPHLRTNGFMAARKLLVRLLPAELSNKMQAYQVEGGRPSLARRAQKMKLRVLVADRHGATFESRDWARSEAFWQGDQKGLLIADNQTDLYEQGDAARRLLLSRFAWGEQAAPSGATP